MHDFVGFCEAELTDNELGLTFRLAIFYPAQSAGREDAVGPYRLVVARDARGCGRVSTSSHLAR